jgi:hypothetical protein
METTEKTASVWELLENPPTHSTDVAQLYSWSLSCEGFKPFRAFLDLIGYSSENVGSNLANWTDPSEGFGYMELGYLAQALLEYSNRPQAVEGFIAELLEAESI